MRLKFKIIGDYKVEFFVEKSGKVFSLGEFYIDNVLADIDELFLSINEVKKELKTFVKNRFDPKRYWEVLENLNTIEEMISRFNELSDVQRRGIADYVLTHVNIFKGKGALFVEHYDPETGKLLI